MEDRVTMTTMFATADDMLSLGHTGELNVLHDRKPHVIPRKDDPRFFTRGRIAYEEYNRACEAEHGQSLMTKWSELTQATRICWERAVNMACEAVTIQEATANEKKRNGVAVIPETAED